MPAAALQELLDRADDLLGHRRRLRCEARGDLAGAVDEEFGEVPLNVARPVRLRRLPGQVGVKRVPPGAVDVDLGEHREGDAEARLAEFLDLRLATWFLGAELIAGKPQYHQAAAAEILVH